MTRRSLQLAHDLTHGFDDAMPEDCAPEGAYGAYSYEAPDQPAPVWYAWCPSGKPEQIDANAMFARLKDLCGKRCNADERMEREAIRFEISQVIQ